jgi:hypothetical protein
MFKTPIVGWDAEEKVEVGWRSGSSPPCQANYFFSAANDKENCCTSFSGKLLDQLSVESVLAGVLNFLG